MKKVSNITIYDNNNYGNRLQNYALQTYLQNLGLDLITFKNNKYFNNYENRTGQVKSVLKYIRNKILKMKKFNFKRNRNFNQFNKMIHLTNRNISIHKASQLECDYYVVGSDQVWKPTYGRMSDLELINFETKAKRISYSASIGIDAIPKKYEEKFIHGIAKFDHISVREDKAKEIIQNLTQREDVEVLIDPTLLLSPNEWIKIMNQPQSLNNNKYILNYFLGNLSAKRKALIEKFAKENECEVIHIMDKKSAFYQCGPAEFLYLIKNAFFVCTDSFHSSVFSFLFDKPFLVFDREENGMNNMNSRIDTLLSKFKLKDRKFDENKSELLIEHDYTEGFKILEKEKEKTLNFFKKAINL